ncbi:phosphoglycerate mutase family protein [Jeotgalibacillus malaysiensis]|uniref:Phosphoglycerate mutase family protein n=1 Tax=Jeotgalibacillus malaysiensis TaxID=1508404 RepID=A0A0B5APJ3_9BACL|nr:histidine phosphatase family protein [Jeotgalibacillus malaysiensis]AJD92175.1 phosphoglycerate mutase family protein [Jeotgalibacillus malaysiensis]
MITEVYMVRHAHSVFSLEFEETRGLSKQGWKSVEKVTEVLKNEEIDVIYSSPYVRARQTLEGLAKELGQEIYIDKRFRERDLAARDHHFEDPISAVKKVFDDYDFKFPEGESNNEVMERGVAALKEVITDHAGKNIAIGIHGNIFACIMSWFDERYGFEFSLQTTKPDIYKLTVDENFSLKNVERLWKTDWIIE